MTPNLPDRINLSPVTVDESRAISKESLSDLEDHIDAALEVAADHERVVGMGYLSVYRIYSHKLYGKSFAAYMDQRFGMTARTGYRWVKMGEAMEGVVTLPDGSLPDDFKLQTQAALGARAEPEVRPRVTPSGTKGRLSPSPLPSAVPEASAPLPAAVPSTPAEAAAALLASLPALPSEPEAKPESPVFDPPAPEPIAGAYWQKERKDLLDEVNRLKAEVERVTKRMKVAEELVQVDITERLLALNAIATGQTTDYPTGMALLRRFRVWVAEYEVGVNKSRPAAEQTIRQSTTARMVTPIQKGSK